MLAENNGLKTEKLNPHASERWSGGGANLFANVVVATEQYPEKFSPTGTPVFLKNIVPVKNIISGGYICIPQNAWPWYGPAKSFKEIYRRTLLRIASEVTFFRAKKIIKIGPMIEAPKRKSCGYLPNVLDEDFENAIVRSRESVPLWLPKEPFFFTPGSFWSYRNLECVIDAYIEYFDSVSKPLPMLIVGPAVQKKYFDKLVLRSKACSGITLIGKKVDRAELLHAMSSAKLTIFSSLVEASPVTLLECAAMQSPCAVSDVSAHRYIEKHLEGATLNYFTDKKQLVRLLLSPPKSTKSNLSNSDLRSEMRLKWARSFINFCLE